MQRSVQYIIVVSSRRPITDRYLFWHWDTSKHEMNCVKKTQQEQASSVDRLNYRRWSSRLSKMVLLWSRRDGESHSTLNFRIEFMNLRSRASAECGRHGAKGGIQGYAVDRAAPSFALGSVSRPNTECRGINLAPFGPPPLCEMHRDMQVYCALLPQVRNQ